MRHKRCAVLQRNREKQDDVSGDEMVAAMNKVGVDGAIFISAFSMYQYDTSYAVEVQQAHPGRFAIVKPVNPDDPAVAEVIADWKKTPGAVGIRIMLTREANRAPDDPGLGRICRAAGRHDFPVNVLFWGMWMRGLRSSIGIPTRDLSSTISASCSRASRPPRRSPGRPAKGAGTRQAPVRYPGSPIRSRTFGARLPGCLMPGFRSLLVGHGLDARIRRRQLRAGRRALPEDRPPQRHRTGNADGGACAKAYGWSPKKG